MLGPLVDRLFGVSEPRATRLTVDRDIHIPMSDGTAALADHYRPAETAGAHPVVLIRTPYGHHTLFGRLLATAFARGGFQVVIQSVRGVFGSGGTASMFHQERSDGLDTVHWLRQQGWCDGRVAMAGASYLGYTQWALAPYVDPPLVAVGLGVTCADFPASFYPGGVIALDNLLSWSALITTQERRSPLGPLAQVGRARTLAAAMRTLPIADGDRAAVGEPVPFFQEVVSHSGVGDDFWSDIDHSSEVATLSAPASMVTGWYDLFLPWQLKDFAVLAEAGRAPRITIGPWSHGEPASLKVLVGDQISWLGAHLRGDLAQLQRQAVRLYLQHADRWLDFEHWPPRESVPTALYLGDHRALHAEPAPASEPDSLRYDPADPTPSVGGALLTGKAKQRDNRAVERRCDVLVYTGTELSQDFDLIGEVTAEIYLRTDPQHADLFVRLCDVDASGVSRNVTDGIRRLRPDAEGPAAVDGAGFRAVRIDLFPTAYRFRAGHRLRVQLCGGAFPRYVRNTGTGEPDAHAGRTVPIRFEFAHDAQRPSRLVLPVFGGARREGTR